MNAKHIIVIGAGLGGLAAAARLAHMGFKVTVLEQQSAVGGKLQRIERKGYSFDRGPSTITMRFAFEHLFASCGKRMENYVQFQELVPRTRNYFFDGHQLDLSSDIAHMQEQMAAYSVHDAMNYPKFHQEAQELYRLSMKYFLNGRLTMRKKLSPALWSAMLRIKPWHKLQHMLLHYFNHSNSLQMFGRYATYIGSSPYTTPSVFAMLSHVESDLGVYSIQGGTYSLVSAVQQLALEGGANIMTNTRVRQVRVRNGSVIGVETDNGDLEADQVIVNADFLSAYSKLIPNDDQSFRYHQRLPDIEPSLSGFSMLLGVRHRYERLLHHTVLFSEDYKREFDDIFRQKRMPNDPTLYICYSGASEPSMAPDGASNLFVLANAPYLSSEWSWTRGVTEAYGERIKNKLESFGFEIDRYLEVCEFYTPQDIAIQTSAFRGAIYGMSSNRMRQAFFRPDNRDRRIDGLWYIGGSVHPGGGTPLVTMSGQWIAEEIGAYIV